MKIVEPSVILLSYTAHPQMREVAVMARDILIGIAPDMFKEFANEGV